MRLANMQEELVTMESQINRLWKDRKNLEFTVNDRANRYKEIEENYEAQRKTIEENSQRLAELQKGSASEIREKYDTLVKKRYELQVAHYTMSKQYQALYQAQIDLEQKLKRASIEQYLIASSKEFSPTLRGALITSTEAFVPFFDTISVYVDANERLLDHVSDEIDRYTHFNVRRSPFVSGLLFYVVMLIPVVAITRFTLAVLRSTRNYSVSFLIMIGSAYFLILSTAGAILNLIFRVDPMIVLSGAGLHRTRFLMFLIMLSVLFGWNVGLLIMQTLASPDSRNGSQLIATVAIGFHFFMFVPRKTFLKELPDVRSHSYLIYATIFSFIVLERAQRLGINLPSRQVAVLWLKVTYASISMRISKLMSAVNPLQKKTKKSSRYSTKADRKIVASQNGGGFLASFLGSKPSKKSKRIEYSDSESESSDEEDRDYRRKSRR